MSDNNTSIHEFDFHLICEYFSAMSRQGPGSEEATLKALSFIEGLDECSKIADLGCGTGAQTLTLSQYTSAHITALDLFPLFVDKLKARAEEMKMAHRIDGIVGSMDNLPFRDEEYNLIWSEGAIYNIGFRKGLDYWRRFIRPGGYIAVSEASWFTDSRPTEIEQFWTDAYPEIDTIPHKVAQMLDTGYVPVATFILPEKCWTDNFYVPQQQAQKLFLQKYAGNPTAEELIHNQRREAQLYARYKQYYGYVFYIGKVI